jgi:hypothetical protein
MIATVFWRKEIPQFLRSRRCLRQTFKRNGFLQISFGIPTIHTGLKDEVNSFSILKMNIGQGVKRG